MASFGYNTRCFALWRKAKKMPLKPETIAARGGRQAPSPNRPLSPPIYQTSVYTFESLDEVDLVWEEEKDGFIYGRYGTPNTAMLEDLLAALEGAEAAVVSSSGMGALSALFMTLLSPGDHLIAGRDLYGSSTALLAQEIRRMGVEISFVDATSPEKVFTALTPRTRAVFVEAISNPLLKLVDIHALAATLRELEIALIVDASLASPAVLRPMELGANIVVQSATKMLSGHSDTTAGAVLGPKRIIDRVRDTQLRLGTNLGPFDAWLVTRGVRTLAVRLEKQCESALALARFLESCPRVERVYYPGLPSHPQHDLAVRLFRGRFGALLSFDLEDGEEGVKRFFEKLRLIEFAPSFGDTATTWSYPARTSHRGLSPAGKRALGIGPGLVRLSVGLEALDDLLRDLGRAL